MRKILLTSGGPNQKLIGLLFKQINKEPKDVKIIFIPSAAMHGDSPKESIALIYYNLISIGILPSNIFMYHLGYLLSRNYNRTYSSMVTDIPPFLRLLSVEELNEFDILLLGGGDAGILLNEINRTGFNEVMKPAVENGLFYLGASAGSMVAAGNLPNNLGYINNPIEVHCEKGTPCGNLPQEGTIYLTDSQAVWIDGEMAQIID